jgi:formate dehydrogenase major subunit
MTDTYVPPIDLGTPPVVGTHDVSVTINGREVDVPAGTSVMRAAALAGVSLSCARPTL